MRFTLLKNGVDSLKAAYECLDKFDNLAEGADHNLKDSVMFLNHGLEILLKLILKKSSPALMFADIKAYQKAKEEMKKAGKSNVFQVNANLHTVSLEDALKRVEFLCDIEIPETLTASIYYINKVRNQFMHFEVEIADEELSEFITKLKKCYEASVEFLEDHIENLTAMIEMARFEYTHEEYQEDMAEWLDELRAEEARMEYEAKMEYQAEMMEALQGHF